MGTPRTGLPKYSSGSAATLETDVVNRPARRNALIRILIRPPFITIFAYWCEPYRSRKPRGLQRRRAEIAGKAVERCHRRHLEFGHPSAGKDRATARAGFGQESGDRRFVDDVGDDRAGIDPR